MRRVLALLFALCLTLVGCGGSDDTSTDTDAGSDDGATSAATEDDGGGETDDGGDDGDGGGEVAGTITILDFAYGEPLTVAPEALIRVVNEDSVQHDVDAVDGESFNNDLLGQGEELTFNAPAEEGTYDFTCSVHPQMSGQLIVAV